jgi:uncharacterized membrane protein
MKVEITPIIQLNTIAHGRFKLFLALLIAGVTCWGFYIPVEYAVAIAFDASALVFLLSTAQLWKSGSPEELRKNAARDDGGRAMLLTVSTVVIGVILVVLVEIIGDKSSRTPSGLAVVIATQVLAWLFANLVWAFHYAHLYYDPAGKGRDQGGLSFPGNAPPNFSDFCYFSLVVGMTFQVSDVEITTSRFRKIAMTHGLVAFFFNLGVLALTVNLIAGAL